MFGLSFWEIAIILAIALIVLGPSKLPELARGLGKALREFRKATEDFKATIDEETHRPDYPRESKKSARDDESPAELLPPIVSSSEPSTSTSTSTSTPAPTPAEVDVDVDRRKS